MNTCETCWWWDARSGGLYTRDAAMTTWGVCARDEDAGCRFYPVSEDDGEHGTMLTAPDFGCVLWEAKS